MRDGVDGMHLVPPMIGVDGIHLEKAGHKLWGEIIGTDLAAMLDTAN